jgi:hypothetical protein
MKIGVNVIPHQWTKEIIDEINELREGGYTSSHAEGLILRGPSGVGKSVLIQRYAEANPASETEDGWVRPVVLVEAPGKGQQKPLAEALLTQLGDPKPARGTETSMMERAKHFIREQKTELIIIDEVQDAMRGNMYDAGNFFKRILNWGLCPLLLVGLPHAIDLLKANEQLRRRCRPDIEMKPFDWFEPDQKRVFRQILKTFEGMLPQGIKSCGLSDIPIAERFNYGTWGTIGRLTPLLREVERLAKRDPKKQITMDLLAEAYESFQRQEPDHERRRNPFRMKEMPERWVPLSAGEKAVAKRTRSGRADISDIAAE